GSGSVRQPVILDDDAAVQNGIVEQLAIRMAKGSVPGTLAGKKLVKLETASLFSNIRSNAEAAAEISALLAEVAASKGKIILFLDELSNLTEIASVRHDLVQGVSDGSICIIGASTVAAYHERIESQTD